MLPLVLLIALSNHRTYSSNYVFNKLVYTKYGPASYKEPKKKAPTFVIIKKKSKTRGIKAPVPQISQSVVVIRDLFAKYSYLMLADLFSQSHSRENPGRAPPAC
jgi:hypothetical protein